MKKLILALVLALSACAAETRVVVVTATPMPPTATPSPPTATPIPPTITPVPWDAEVSGFIASLYQLPNSEAPIMKTLAAGLKVDLLAVTEDKEWVQATADLGDWKGTGWLLVDRLELNVSLDDLAVDTETAIVPPPTSAPEPTPTASPEPQLRFEDDFESGESEWFVGDFLESSTYVSNGQLVIEVHSTSWSSWTEHPEFGLLEDSVLEVDISYISGPSNSAAGILFRCLGEGGDFLKIVFNADGFLVVAVVSFVEGEFGYFEFVPWTRYVDIERGQAVNHVRVIDDDQQLTMFINDQLVADLNFSDMVPPGCPSLFAETFDQAGAVWAFDNFKVRDVGP